MTKFRQDDVLTVEDRVKLFPSRRRGESMWDSLLRKEKDNEKAKRRDYKFKRNLKRGEFTG